MRWALVTLLLASCDIVYGLDRPPTPEPGTDMVTATFVRRQLGAEGGSVVELPADDVTASVVLANGAKPDVVREGSEFRFAWTRGMTYYLTFEQPDRPPLTYVADTETLFHARRELAHEGVTPAPGSALKVAMTNFGPQTTFTFLAATGVWLQASSPAPPTASFAVDFTSTTPFLTRRPRLLDGDRVYCSELDNVSDGLGIGNLGYNALKRWAMLDNVRMEDGAVTTADCPLVEMPLTECAEMVPDRAADLVHLDASVAASNYPTIVYSTFVLAVPEPSLGPYDALSLAFAQGAGALPPFTGTLHYQNPYVGHGVAVLSTIGRFRNVSARGRTGTVSLLVGTSHWYEPVDDCATTPAVLSDLPIPSPPAFGGVYLVNDGELELSSTRPIEVSWENRTGDVDYYDLQLFEIGPGPAESDSKLTLVREWITTKQEMTLDRGTFEPGVQYAIAITASYGWANTATGDYATTRWPSPLGTGTNVSGVFTVKP